MAGTGGRFGDGRDRVGFNKDAVRLCLIERAEDLFRDLLGEPERASAPSWRPKSNPSLSFAVRGRKRGYWKDFATDDGGDVLDLVAVYLCGFSKARDDFTAVLAAAAQWAGIASGEVDRAEVNRRLRQQERRAAAEAAREKAQKAETVARVVKQARPVEATPAATYLASRGIVSWPEGALAYQPGHQTALIVWAKDDAGNIVGGQRIFITEAGARASGPDGTKQPKKSFGLVQGFPARLSGSNDRLYVVEGPETALSVWAATGAEVWAVFGCASFKAAPLPLDRPVIFCPDRDPPDSPAAKGFGGAVAHHLSQGVDLWIARAPEPEGSKADLNDTHQRAGLDAVRTALQAAEHVTKPSPDKTTSLDSGPPLRPTEGLAAVLDVEEARRLLRAEVRDGLRRPRVTLLEATLGLGKTHATTEEVVKLLADAKQAGIENPAVVIAVPMHRLGRQMKADIATAAPDVRIVQLYGPEADDPDDPSRPVCKRLNEYRERQALLLDMQKFCDACTFVGSCLHVTGKAQQAEIYLVSHERLKAARTPLKKGQTLVATVVDENPMNALVNVNRRPWPLAALKDSPTRIGAKGKETKRLEAEADLRAFRSRLATTIRTHGPGYLRLSELSDWSVADAEAAAGLEWMRKVEDEGDPQVMGNKTITFLAGIYAEIARSLRDKIAENARLKIFDSGTGLQCLLSGMKPVSAAFRKAPVLMLDATARAEIVQLLIEAPLAHHAKIIAHENVLIEQDPDWSGAKSKFFDDGKPNGNIARVRRFAELQAMTSSTVVIGNKNIIAELHLPPHIKTAHFNALRGLNDFAEAETLVILGRPLPDAEVLGRMVAAMWGTPCSGMINHIGKVWRRVLHDGQVMEAETKAAIHEDPRAELLLSLIRDAEVAQAVGRLRGVNRTEPVRCILLSDAVVNYSVRLMDIRSTLRVCGIVGEMLERGVAFLSPSHAAAAYPDLYASKQAAARVLDQVNDRATFSIKELYGKGCPVVTLKRPRSHSEGIAIVRPDLLDVEAAIDAALPDAKIIGVRRPENPVTTAEAASPHPVASVLNLGEVRRARADKAAETEFQKALNRARHIQQDTCKPSAEPVTRKVVGGYTAACSTPRLVWALTDKPKPLPYALRRYSVSDEIVRAADGKQQPQDLSALAEWQFARLTEWFTEEPDEADYWR